MALTDLPTELLARICHFLDWDPTKDIRPSQRDLISVSLTCHKLRDGVLPTLFRNVRLELRWEHGMLVEPRLYWLRRNCPHLTRYVRCVEIDTKFSNTKAPTADGGRHNVFMIPTDMGDWVDPDSVSSLYQDAIFTEVRAQADSVAQQLYHTYTEEYALPSGNTRSAEDIIRDIVIAPEDRRELSATSTSQHGGRTHPIPTPTGQSDAELVDVHTKRERRRSIRFSLEALAVGEDETPSMGHESIANAHTALLCIPPSTDTLIFRAIPTHYRQYPRTEFGLRVAKAAILVFRNRIRDLTVVMKQRFRAPPTNRFCTPQALPIEQEEDPDTNESINGLQCVERLVLTCCDEREFPVYMSTLTRRNLFQWRQLATRVKHLDLRCARICYDDLMSFVECFRGLHSLRLDNIVLDDHTGRLRRVDLTLPYLIWLLAAVEIRQALQHTQLLLGELHIDSALALPTGGVAWIAQEAVPSGIIIDTERRERLIEDFNSFLPTWQAEQAGRGSQAQFAWDRTGGMLVDQAMSSRWR